MLTRFENDIAIMVVIVKFGLHFVGPKKHTIAVLVDDEVEVIESPPSIRKLRLNLE